MVIRALSTIFLSLFVVITLIGCGSSSDSTPNPISEPNEPFTGEANSGIDSSLGSSASNTSLDSENQEETQFAAITFESDVVEDTGAFNRLKVTVDKEVFVENNAQQITIGLQGVSFVEMKQPENCNLASTDTDNETNDELPRTVVCDLIATTNDETNNGNVEKILPVYIILMKPTTLL